MNHVIVVMTAPISTTNITGLRICTRGIELLQAVEQRAHDDVAPEQRDRAPLGGCWWRATCLLAPCEAVEGEVQLQHVDARLTEETEAAAGGIRGDQAVDGAQRQCRG